MDPADRRRHPRLHLDGRMVGRATVMTDFRVVALSETGGSLEMDVPLAAGAFCDLSLQLAHVSVDLRGRVVEVSPPEASRSAYLVAVEFEGMNEVDSGLLSSFLERERQRGA
jgi:hypothetical protein